MRIFLSTVLAVLAVMLSATLAWALSPTAQKLLDAAAADCSSFENGAFDAGDAVQDITLASQFGTVAAELIDESKYSCSSSASMYCGSGGCMLNVVVEGAATAWQATGWQLVNWGPDTILLIGRDGGWCGGSGAEVCYEALVWSDGKVLTVGPEAMVRE